MPPIPSVQAILPYLLIAYTPLPRPIFAVSRLRKGKLPVATWLAF